MDYRPLGRAAWDVAEISFGAWDSPNQVAESCIRSEKRSEPQIQGLVGKGRSVTITFPAESVTKLVLALG